jgi:beta-lactamase class A
MCSTFKFALAAAILRRVEQNKERLDRRLPVRAADIVPNSPFCESRVGGSAGIGELCRETIKVSDNAAANLLLRTIGGPAGFTGQLRGFGDAITRLDRWEPDMGEAAPGDPRDTTSPRAFADLAQRLLLGNALSSASRSQLTGWMKATTTSRTSLRAGLPRGWVAADKTGSGGHGTANLLGIVWPPRHAPLVVASYITGTNLPLEQLRPLHARIGRALAAAYA